MFFVCVILCLFVLGWWLCGKMRVCGLEFLLEVVIVLVLMLLFVWWCVFVMFDMVCWWLDFRMVFVGCWRIVVFNCIMMIVMIGCWLRVV